MDTVGCPPQTISWDVGHHPKLFLQMSDMVPTYCLGHWTPLWDASNAFHLLRIFSWNSKIQ